MTSLPSARRWLLPGSVALVILIASLHPGTPGGPGPETVLLLPGDKVAHLLSYAGLAGLTVLTSRRRTLDHRFLLLVAVGVMLYGAGIEVLQSFIPPRHCSVGDMAANGIGAAGGVLVGRWLRRTVRSGPT